MMTYASLRALMARAAFVFLLAAAIVPRCCAQAAEWKTAPVPMAASAPTAVPALVPYSGVAVGSDGKPLSGEVGVTLLIFTAERGGEPLFIETQTVAVDPAGRYTAQLGATLSNGIPMDLFATGEARWLEVQIAGQDPQPRVLLTSVPYALKAGDASTLGGLPASAYALAGTNSASTAALTPEASPAAADVTTIGGVSGYLAEFSGASTIVDSPIFVNGANVGIGIATPSQTLDVNGATAFRGNANFFWNGSATPSKGANSSSLTFSAESYDSSTASVIRPYFSLLAEAAGNNTSTPSATLNLQYSNGTTLAETGFHINSNGTINFASGQTFPATSAAGTAVDGTSTSGTGVEGSSSSGDGVYGVSGGPSGVEAVAPAGVWGDSANDIGVLGTSYGGGYGVAGYGTFAGGVFGSSFYSTGVEGTSNSTVGVQGLALRAGTSSAGVYGVLSTPSTEGKTDGGNSGVWADTATAGASALVATADNGYAGLFYNNSATYRTLYALNDTTTSSTAFVFAANGSHLGGSCHIDVNGDLGCNGTVTDVVKVDNGTRQVETYSVQSPENWFEDFGSGRLSGGVDRIDLDLAFAQTVNAGTEYHVFLTPKGDCKGLFVTGETAEGFEVRELGGGTSSVAFDYRIVAKRAGYEAVRLKDVTEQMRQAAEQEAAMKHSPVNETHPVVPAPTPPRIPAAESTPQRLFLQPKYSLP